MIKTVIFDIDGVLTDSLDANLKFFQELMEKNGYKSPTKDEYIPLFNMTLWDTIKELTKLSSSKEIDKIWGMGKEGKVKYPNNLLKVTKDVKKVLELLHKKYILGIVTSRIKEGFYNAPVLFKLNKYFSAVITYEDTINHKPDPEPLMLACKKLKAEPQNAVYIGDQQNDIIAAKAAGMKVILYAENNFGNPDLFTSNFKELPKLIEKLG